MTQSLDYNDGILIFSLLDSCVDLHFEWEAFDTCIRPVHHWLLVSYACVVVCRLTHLLGSRWTDKTAGEPDDLCGMGDFLLDLRHKNVAPKALAAFTWLVALPFFAGWTILGTSWYWSIYKETPQCVPSVAHLWFSGFWLALCYAWVITHIAFGVIAVVLERRVRRAEGDLREIEDDDVLQRWGQVSRISGYHVLADQGAPTMGSGLTISDIKKLPSESSLGSSSPCGEDAEECPICITVLQEGDMVRRLPGCGHAFHRSCIDLWLLRRADCPLCKHSLSDLLTTRDITQSP